MIKETLDNKNFRIAFAVLIGIPSTFVYLIAAIYGYVFVISLFYDLKLIPASMAIATILGTFGILGAWFRIIKQSKNLTPRQLKFTRNSLACGIIASIILLANAIGAGSLFFGVPLLFLTVAGVLFYVGT